MASQYFASLQTAYELAISGDDIWLQALDLGGGFALTQNKAVSLIGGRNCDYSSAVGNTIIHGFVIIFQALAFSFFLWVLGCFVCRGPRVAIETGYACRTFCSEGEF